MAAAIAAMTARLKPGPKHRETVAIMVTRLLAAFPSERLDDVTAKARAEAFWQALSDKPGWAIEDTVVAIVRGEEPGMSRSYAPTPPALAAAVLRRIAPIFNDRRRLEIVAVATPYSEPPPAKQFIIDGFDDLRHEIASKAETAARERHERFLAEMTDADERRRVIDCQREGIDPALGVTPALLRVLREKPITSGV